MTKSKKNFIERRQAVRSRRILSIQFRLFKSKSKRRQDTAWHISTTHDMSATGLSFISDVAYQIGDILELNMVLSGVIDIYKGFGKVVRLEEKNPGSIYFIAVKLSENEP